MKRVVAILVFAALFLTSCASYKDIKLTSFEVVSLSPNGLREVDATVRVGIDNPIMTFIIRNVDGTIRDGDTPLAYIVSDQLMVDGHTEKTYDIPVKATLAEGTNVLKLVTLISRKDYSSILADVSLKASLRSGIGKTIVKKDIPILK